MAWSAAGASGACAGNASDYTWTDTISETAGVPVTLASLAVTIDGTAAAPSTVSKSVPGKGQTTSARELCFPGTGAHSVTSQYSGTDANGHAVTASLTISLAGKPAPAITNDQVSRLASAIASAGGPLLGAVIEYVFTQSDAGVYHVDQTQSCRSGGSAHTTGPATITLSGENSGSIAIDASLQYGQCSVDGTVLDGGPLTIKGQMNVVDGDIQNPITFTITGTHAIAVDGVSGTVSFNCDNSLTVDNDTFTPTSLVAAGNASILFPTGQNPTTAPCQTFANAFDLSSILSIAGPDGHRALRRALAFHTVTLGTPR